VIPEPVTPNPAPANPTPEPAREPPPPPVPQVSDRDLIAGVLQRYAQGYQALNAAAVAAVYPGVDITALRKAFEDTRELTMQIDIQNVDINGNVATVTSNVRQRFRGKVGGAENSSARTQFQLQKRGATWVITSRK
jgi:hypothetical protein